MTNERKIWDYLYNEIGNRWGVAGLMGNLMAESALLPNNVQNSFEGRLGSDEEYTRAVDNGTRTREQFAHDGAGYGLAQWTFWSRKAALYDYCKNADMSIAGLFAQLGFMLEELNQYKLLDQLKNAKSVRDASDIILTQYEKPADQSQNAKDRRFKLASEILARNAHEDAQSDAARDILVQVAVLEQDFEKLKSLLDRIK